ncbi:glutathione S-transferase Mu 3-like isoform X2 [Actinia tenebrosa]|uniref:glutathione transferase n=1 Tax=Actinia tenebrosa TaxID=6105 RepID=A0A6P8J044_ACTTE|nr:glutathione S-transferase Mu 3-like isoform X1 [Actinia tenebrosa]XP_031572823.1 glutathione S-transferase Mu 3-like isoform X2 [Actinia tenebrosa]
MAPIFGYWDIRGLAQPIRLLMHYVGMEFEDKRYSCGPAPDYSRESWLKEKFTLGLDFPNLPYYIDGDIKITQSGAILRHIARKKNLCGETEKERIIVDMMENQIQDFRSGFSALCYRSENFDEEKPKYLKNVVPKIKAFADFLGEKKYLVGDKITFVDFMLYETLDHHKVFDASLLEPHANLKAYLERIEALPAIAAYMKSDDFISRPINNTIAKFR